MLENIATPSVRTAGKGKNASITISLPKSQSSAGTAIKWAKIKSITDANNYKADIYTNRDKNFIEENADVKVYDIIDNLEVDDWIPVAKMPTGTNNEKIYVSIQQLGDL